MRPHFGTAQLGNLALLALLILEDNLQRESAHEPAR